MRLRTSPSDTSESNRLYATKTLSTRNEARDSTAKCDVDVGWERSEPSSIVKHLLPISAVQTHMKLEVDGTAVRFRLTEQST